MTKGMTYSNIETLIKNSAHYDRITGDELTAEQKELVLDKLTEYLSHRDFTLDNLCIDSVMIDINVNTFKWNGDEIKQDVKDEAIFCNNELAIWNNY